MPARANIAIIARFCEITEARKLKKITCPPLGRLWRIYLERVTMTTIHAQVRKQQGKGASRRLRNANKFPAIIYGGNAEAISIELDHNALMHLQEKAEFYDEPLTIVIDGQETKVKVQAIQRHPYKPKLLHIDFLRS